MSFVRRGFAVNCRLTSSGVVTLKPLHIASSLLLCLALASCATMSPEECRFANWSDVGMRDGLEGKSLELLNTRIGDCSEASVRVDGNAYLKGRDVGLKTYCQLENAVAVGLNGGRYEGVCPAQIDAEFRRRFTIAHNVYAARGEVARIDSRMQSLDQRLHRIDRDEDKRLHDARKDEDRRRIRRDYDDERQHIRDELRDLDYAMHRARDAERYAEWVLSTLR